MIKTRELDEQDLIRFAENVGELSPENHRKIMEQVVSNPHLRKRVARIRKDLYLVDSQIPEYSISAEFHTDLKNLAELWLRNRFERRLRMSRFLFGKEFLYFASVLIVVLLIATLIIYVQS